MTTTRERTEFKLPRALPIFQWFDSWSGMHKFNLTDHKEKRIDWLRCLPFALMHVACLGVIWVGWSPVAVWTAFALYVVRMFAITAFYHRYFSHCSFKASRTMQFIFAVMGGSAVQRGPLWWAAHHRGHHRRSDESGDPHSPTLLGFWWSHCGWITSRANFYPRLDLVRDLTRFPELVFLDRFDTCVPVILGALLFGFGALLGHFVPTLGTSGMQMFVWGIVSTIFCHHATFTINSLAHLFGRRPYETSDTSRNSFLLALITFGEGWHNNHHHYQASVRQGFRWWQIDLSWYGLVCMSWLGLVRDLKPVPQHVIADAWRSRQRRG